jgi:hypothetical protein
LKYFFLFCFSITVQFSFGQCDEYYLNELISGSDEKCSFPSGSPVRFCPSLRGVSINGYAFDTFQWDGISTQHISLTKDGGVAGTLVLKLKERELVVNLNGCGGKRTYSISFNKEEFNEYFRKKELKEREIEAHKILIKNQIKENLNANQIIEAAKIYELNSLNDNFIFDEIQRRISKISLDKQPNDVEVFKLLNSKLGEDKLLDLPQGSYTLSSDTTTGLTFIDNNTGQIFKLDNNVISEKIGKFDRINQFAKKIEIKKTVTLHGVKLNPQWNGNLSNGSVTIRFFKASKKGKTVILGGVKDDPPSKYTNVEIVPGGLKNVLFDAQLELKKGKFLYSFKISFNGVERLNKVIEEKDVLDLDWFYF